MPSKKLTHLDDQGRAKMVNVGPKPVTARTAVAEGYITLSPPTLRAIAEERVAKGEVLAVARVAGIMAAKRTGDLIPLCHGLSPDSVAVDFDVPALPLDTADDATPTHIRIRATASIHAKTGIEMEALTAVAVAALTIYDMCKAIDKSMSITNIRILSKTGGKSDYHVADAPTA
jgi:cyclic pyranopterin phosphate synthase